MKRRSFFTMLGALALVLTLLTTAATLSAQDTENPPWFSSLMAYEHYDSGRSHLFEQAEFNGSFENHNTVDERTSPDNWLTPYNIVYQGEDSIFLFGGGYGDRGGTGAFAARIDPATLKTIWQTQLINTVETGDWNYPGVVSLLQDGYLYLIYGYHLAKLDPANGQVIGEPLVLPTLAEPSNTSYNGYSAFEDGTIVAKTVYRQAGCTLQGFQAFLNCPNPQDVPNSLVVAIDPTTMQVVSQVEAPQFSGGRISATNYNGKNYAYLTGTGSFFRFLWENGQLTLDESWSPGEVLQAGQNGATALVVMNDWVIADSNATPSTTPMSVIAINQGDASQQIILQPFADSRVPQSWSPSSVTVDPARNRVYAFDGLAGMIAALDIKDGAFQPVWTERQRTIEFLTLMGPPDKRVLVGTDVPLGQQMGTNTESRVIWRNAETGQELARTGLLPAINGGTMVEPAYGGKMYYLAGNGHIIEFHAREGDLPVIVPSTGGSFYTGLAVLLAVGILMLGTGWFMFKRGTRCNS